MSLEVALAGAVGVRRSSEVIGKVSTRSSSWRGRLVRALTVSLAATLGALATGTGDVAHAQDVCPGYYITAFKANLFGQHGGEGSATYNPGLFSINTRNPLQSFMAFGGVTRPRRSATFRFTDESGNYIWFNRGGESMINFVTSAAEDNGVIKQEKNVLPWTGDLAQPGRKLLIYGDFSHRCGGDDVRVDNVFVGYVITYPSVPIEINPKFVVLSVAYSPPGRQSSVDYGFSTTVGSRISFSNSFQGGISVTNTRQIEERTSISTTGSFTQRATIGGSDSLEKAESTNLIIPGPAVAIDGISHDFDVYEVWLNARYTVTSTSFTAVETSGYSVDPRDPVPGMDTVRLSVQELRNPALIPPGTASRLQRSWSPTGALNQEDFNTILGFNPFANGGTAIDPQRYTLLDGVNFDYRPADPGGQPITQRAGVRVTASSSSSQAFTTTVKVDKSISNTSFDDRNPKILEIEDKIKVENKVTRSFEASFSLNLDQFNTATQSTNVSITGPATGYQGPTALRLYQDNLFGTIMFAFAEVATFQVGTTTPDRTVTQGQSAAFAITTQAQFGFQDPVTFEPTVMDLPAGATASFTPTTVGPNGGTTLTVTTSTGTPAGRFPLTLTARSGLIRRNFTVNLTVQQLPFTVTAGPPSRTVNPGQSAVYTVTVTAAQGFSGPVQLSGPSGLPPGTGATFNPPTINGSGESTLTITTSPSTPGGTRNLTISATGGGITRTATVGLVVDATQDFGLNVTPQAAGIFAGQTASYTVTTSAINGFGGNVNLTMSGHPAGSTPTFTVNPIAGAGSSTLNLATTTSTPPGDYQLTITGTSGGLTHSRTVALSVSAPPADFSLSASPGTRSVQAGGNTTYALSTTASGGFNSTIDLSVSGLPAGTTAAFSPASAVSAGSGATLTVNVGAATAPGNYQLVITGVGGTLSRAQAVGLTVTSPPVPPATPDFSVSVGPSGRTAPRGTSTTYTVSTAAVNGFTGNIGLSVAGLPSGVTGSFNFSPVTPGNGSALTVNVLSTAAPGDYQLTVTGTSGSLSHAQTVTLSVPAPAPAFTVTLDSNSFTVPRGGVIIVSVSATPSGTFFEPIDLSMTGLPAGIAEFFDTNPIYPYGLSNLYITVGASTAPGTYTLTVTGTAGGNTNSKPLTIVVT